MSNLYCIDGSNLAFRAHCAFPSLTIADGFPIGATYGTIRILQTFIQEFQPGKVIIPFDTGKSKYRLGLYPKYKAGRDDPKTKQLKADFIPQLDLLIELVGKFGFTTLAEETKGIEGDDVISYLVYRYRKGDFPNITRVMIISSDKDLAGLVGADKVVWFDPIKHDIITHENFEEKFGIKIEQYADYKALKGDTSDNIPHPPGIGPVNAANLLRMYGSVARLLEVSHSKVEPSRTIVKLALQLVSLNLHQVMPEDPVWSRIDQKIAEGGLLAPTLNDTLKALEFNSILENWEEMEPKWKAFSEACL